MLFNFLIRIPEHAPRADKSAVGAINRPLRSGRINLLIYITGTYGWPEECVNLHNHALTNHLV